MHVVGTMKNIAPFWIEHTPDWRHEPMAYWVHRQTDGLPWGLAASYDPPAPRPEGRKGYPVLCIASQGFVFRFSSGAQLAECIEILGRKPLPTSRRLSSIRSDVSGPNKHWLSRLPAHIKSPKARQRAVEDLHSVTLAMTPINPFKPNAHRASAVR